MPSALGNYVTPPCEDDDMEIGVVVERVERVSAVPSQGAADRSIAQISVRTGVRELCDTPMRG